MLNSSYWCLPSYSPNKPVIMSFHCLQTLVSFYFIFYLFFLFLEVTTVYNVFTLHTHTLKSIENHIFIYTKTQYGTYVFWSLLNCKSSDSNLDPFLVGSVPHMQKIQELTEALFGWQSSYRYIEIYLPKQINSVHIPFLHLFLT